MTTAVMSTVHVLGASSALGRAVVERALRAGFQVHAYSREERIDDRPGVSWHALDLDRPSDLNAVRLAPQDRVVCAAPIAKLAAASSVAKHFQPTRIIATSSASALTKQKSKWPCDRELSLRLQAAELTVLSLFEARASILRPTMIYGSGHDRNIALLARLIRGLRVFPIFGQRAGLRAPIHVEDLADIAIALASADRGAGVITHVQGGEVLDYRTLVHRIAQACGSTVWTPQIPIPSSLVASLAKCLPCRLARLAAAIHRMEEDLTVPDDVASVGVSRRGFHPDRKSVGLDGNRWNRA
jgi:nucleoside-diphosphate-sugar epimerase